MYDNRIKNPFDSFYAESGYTALKRHLYNYRLRKMAISSHMDRHFKWILEIGSGISPISSRSSQTIFTDLSLPALQHLKSRYNNCFCVVCDARYLPFKPQIISCLICSEVLEHINEDEKVLSEISKVLNPGGQFLMTVPHRRAYFSIDDRFVGHIRRYEKRKIIKMLENAGFTCSQTVKVLGPLEKIMMIVAVSCYSKIQKYSSPKTRPLPIPMHMILEQVFKWVNFFVMSIVKLDAWVSPNSLASNLLLLSHKKK